MQISQWEHIPRKSISSIHYLFPAFKFFCFYSYSKYAEDADGWSESFPRGFSFSQHFKGTAAAYT